MTPSLETERLLLRVPIQDDFDDGWAEFHGDPESMRWLGGPATGAMAWRSLAQVVGMWSLRGFGTFSVIEKASGRWIGRVGPWQPEGWPEREVGWMLLRSHWGQGYATEAGRACLDLVFGDLAWPRVAHLIHPENENSQAVAARLGSRLIGEARLPDSDQPVQMWGQDAEDWRSK
ncbi:MAG: GNAT family N-acetyltransferase [Caulobacteraceae bacterium]